MPADIEARTCLDGDLGVVSELCRRIAIGFDSYDRATQGVDRENTNDASADARY
jgi:hypothetical protein